MNATGQVDLAAGESRSPALEITGLSKTFPGQTALDDVALRIEPGQVHALIGENGSGKSTLIKVLSGYHTPDPGAQLEIAGESGDFERVAAEHRSRIRFVHQDHALVPTLSARENLSLTSGSQTGVVSPIDRRAERSEIERTLDDFGIEVDIDVPVEQLGPHERASIAIARALAQVDDETAVLVLDEPTASLGREEVIKLFAAVRRVQARGIGVLYVSHFLEEVLELSDAITVLRDGRVVDQLTTTEATTETLVAAMLGASVESTRRAAEVTHGAVVLDVAGLSTRDLDDVSFQVRSGEVLGVTGLLGSGYETLGRALLGLEPWRAGAVSVDGARLDDPSPSDAVAVGLAVVPVDRRRLGLLADFSIAENMTLPRLKDLWKGGRLRRRLEDQQVVGWLEEVSANTRDPRRRLDELSGGNQQKVLIAKWLRTEPKALVVEEPTQAVDVGAKASIEAILLERAADGCAVVICSAEAGDLARLCDRVIVVRDGRVAVSVSGDDLTEHRVIVETHGVGNEAGVP